MALGWRCWVVACILLAATADTEGFDEGILESSRVVDILLELQPALEATPRPMSRRIVTGGEEGEGGKRDWRTGGRANWRDRKEES